MFPVQKHEHLFQADATCTTKKVVLSVAPLNRGPVPFWKDMKELKVSIGFIQAADWFSCLIYMPDMIHLKSIWTLIAIYETLLYMGYFLFKLPCL